MQRDIEKEGGESKQHNDNNSNKQKPRVTKQYEKKKNSKDVVFVCVVSVEKNKRMCDF